MIKIILEDYVTSTSAQKSDRHLEYPWNGMPDKCKFRIKQFLSHTDAQKKFKQKMLSRHLSEVLSLTSAELQLLQERLQQQQPTAAAAKAAESPKACTAAATGVAAASCAYYNIGDDSGTCYYTLDSYPYKRKLVGLRKGTSTRTSTW